VSTLSEVEKKERKVISDALYYQKNKDKFKIKRASYYQKNKASENAKAAEYYVNNREEILEHNAGYRVKNQESVRKQKRDYYQKNKEYVLTNNKQYRDNNYDSILRKKLQNHYGLSLEDYRAMEISQNGVCKICYGPPGGRIKRLCVDHCHKTGKIRGLLCSKCNRAIGMLGDDPETIERASLYLRGSA